MKYKLWKQAPCMPDRVRALAAQGMPPLVAVVLCARGMCSMEQARAFFSSDESLLCDPFLLRDMDRAVARLERALAGREKIVVYGDYDVDGITATCLLTDYLRARGGDVQPYIPDRLEEGYGLNREAVAALHAAGVGLIVTVDCGITAVEETRYANSLGMEIIITDHHECGDILPDAAAVIDPHRKDCGYPFPCLAGVGVALKLVLALGGVERQEQLLGRYADLAAIGTVADVMRLVDENRTIVRLGLETLKDTARPGLRALLRESGAEGRPVTASTVGYILAPRINASGRMGCADLAAELLLTAGPARAAELAKSLCDLNRERQAVEGEIFTACTELLEREAPRSRRAIVLADENWHQGVVGIVASRLAEKYACPVFMICLQNGVGKGSCRSYAGFNLYEALQQCTDLLESFGGHALAAGFIIREEQIPAFRARMDELVNRCTGGAEMVSVLEVDAELDDAALLSEAGVEALSRLEPYGTGNPRPVFSLSCATVVSMADVGGGRHLKLRLSRDGRTFDAIFFSATGAQCGFAAGDKVDVAFYPQINDFRNGRSVQLQVVDIRPAPTRAQMEQAVYEKLRRGETLTAREARILLPSREEFAGLWRYLKGHAPGGTMEETVCRLSRCVSRTYGLRETATRTLVCLQVLDECGLIELEHSTDRLRISLCRTVEKVDLEQSPVMRRLRGMTAE